MKNLVWNNRNLHLDIAWADQKLCLLEIIPIVTIDNLCACLPFCLPFPLSLHGPPPILTSNQTVWDHIS